MKFEELLNDYIEKINCSSKELAEESSISTAVISRFRNGLKTPKIKSNQLEQLSDGISKIANKNGITMTKESIYSSFLNTLEDNIDMEELIKNLNQIMNTFNISILDLANGLDLSCSTISKIKTGQRYPSKPREFVDGICKYLVNHYQTNEAKKAIATILNCSVYELSNDIEYERKISKWLSSKSATSVNNFLNNLDEFNLDEYIKTIHFDDIKIPHIPFYKARCLTYYGIEEMKKAELEFFKATVLSKSDEPIFMCSDMPMEDMAKDKDFSKKWMYAIAMALKKGLKLNIIHNIDRPFNEMILGLESWIPLYMTGQVSPYYLKDFQDNTYCHFNYVSGAVCLSGECIKGYHNDGKYTLSSNIKELEYYTKKAQNLLNKAIPLMEIYTIDQKVEFNDFISADTKIISKRRRILSTLPIHTISKELVLKILNDNKIPSNKATKILETINQEKERIKTILNTSTLIDELEEISEEEFNKSPQTLFLANSFYTDKVHYTYKDYLEHLKLSKEYSNQNKNYKFKINKNNTFKNIQIYINEKNYVMISKNTNPSIHFVIKHPKLRTAIENFIPPILDYKKD